MALRILLVDDHGGFRAMARRLLELGGLEVVGEAADGREALALVQAVRPELVLLDILLPDIDGFEVAEWIAAQPYPPSVLLISSRPRSDFGARLDSAPSVGFLAKEDLTAQRVAALAAGGGR
jgi:CheY-like chemotaxis protein